MTNEVLERIQSSIGTGEALRIIYYGGSQPGTAREIVPLSIVGDMLWAISGNRRKQFALAKIAFPDADAAPPDYTDGPLWPDFAAFIAATGERFETGGYMLKKTEDESGGIVGVAVHEFTKAGKPRVRPTFILEYLTTREDEELDENGRWVVVTRPRAKCWVLWERGKRAKSYSTLASAGLELLNRTIGFAPGVGQK